MNEDKIMTEQELKQRSESMNKISKKLKEAAFLENKPFDPLDVFFMLVEKPQSELDKIANLIGV
jgi:hypothetical protein